MINIKKYILFLLLLKIACWEGCNNTKSSFSQIVVDTVYNESESWKISAAEMVKTQIIERGIKDTNVLKVMKNTPRHLFVPLNYRETAFIDSPLPIEEKQTISQPYIVALMTELLELKGNEIVLEIGTGSGYQAAILSPLVKEVYSIEIIKSLAEKAKVLLDSLKYSNIHINWGDGYKGWKEFAPYDGIIVTAAPETIPEELIKQLKEGGRLVIPVGEYYQQLILLKKENGKIIRKNIIPVRFVPMVRPVEK